MKRNFKLMGIGVALMLLISLSVSSQTDVFKKGDLVMNAGIGLGANYGSYWGTGYTSTLPPIFVTGDYCIREDLGPGNLGVGGLLAYSAYKWEYDANAGYKYTTFFIGVRGTYHFTDLVPKMDLYGVVTIGGKILNDKAYGDYTGTYTVNGSSGLFEIAAGARYYFSDSFGVMGELGYGVAWLKLGVSLKF
jgi:hypothetical protein